MTQDLSIPTYSKLLGALYDGHIEEDPYGHFLQSLRGIMNLNFASMTLREPIGEDGGLLFISSDVLQKTFVDDHSNPYTDRYYTSDLMTNLNWGEVVTLDQCTSFTSLETSDLYKICMQPINIYHMAGIDLRNANGQRFSVRFCRPKDSPNFSAEDRDFLSELGTHIQRAVANGMQLIQLDSERKVYAKTITGQSIGIITLDERGMVLNCNTTADKLLREKDGIAIINQQIYLHKNSERIKLSSYIDAVIDAQHKRQQAPINAMAVDRPSGKPDYEILVKPIAIDPAVEYSQTPHLILFISDPLKKNEVDAKILTSLYGLSRAEALLAQHLAAGASLDQSANALGIARNTARAQLRSIFSKTGVTQQSMLVSLILKSLATFS
ncbi:MAG: DNA-binding CsgD family transcriptional regulator [Halieaceae bacterium]|jgi:DNA-binding CsgD family transcriptional regulator